MLDTFVGSSSSLSLRIADMFGGLRRSVAAGAPARADMDDDKDLAFDSQTRRASVQIVDAQEENNLQRALGQRHIQMIALAGAIVSYLPFPLSRDDSHPNRALACFSVLEALSRPVVRWERCLDMPSSASLSVPYSLPWEKRRRCFP